MWVVPPRYASIRQLDAGTLSVDAFEQELRGLGVVLPPAARACLARHRAAGDVKFAAFVQAFEEFFAARTPAEISAGNTLFQIGTRCIAHSYGLGTGPHSCC